MAHRESPQRPLADNNVPTRDASRRVIAPLTVDGAINGELFLAWVQQHLVPALRSGDIVVIDNLSSPKLSCD